MSFKQTMAIHGIRSSDGAFRPLEFDSNTDTLQVIDYAHHKIHDGAAFTASFSADVAATTGKLLLLIVTPNTDVFAHLKYNFNVEGEADIMLYEAPTATAGDAVVAYNRNRNSAVAATVVVTSTPTSITEGTTIIRKHHLIAGGSIKSDDELILKKNTKYLLSIANATGATNFTAVNLDWYEHTNVI